MEPTQSTSGTGQDGAEPGAAGSDTESSPGIESSSTAGDTNGSGRLVLWAAGIAVVAAFFLFVAFSGGDDGGSPSGDGVASPIANLAFTTEDGGTADLASFSGEPLVVNFFASWCAPCRAEMPEFEQVHLANIDRVKFVGVSHDIDEATWKGFVEETEVTFETVFQPNTEIWSTLDAKGMPSTAFISADGEVQYLYTGVLNEELLQELIDEHLLEGA